MSSDDGDDTNGLASSDDDGGGNEEVKFRANGGGLKSRSTKKWKKPNRGDRQQNQNQPKISSGRTGIINKPKRKGNKISHKKSGIAQK